MKKLLTLLTVGLSLSLGSAFAADAPAKSSQRNKMASCNKDAGDKKLKGDERKAQTLNEKSLEFSKRQIEREENRVKQQKAEAEANQAPTLP